MGDSGAMKQVQIGTLKFREIRGDWVAFYALPKARRMAGMQRRDAIAVRLGSMPITVCNKHPNRKWQFRLLMQDLTADIIEMATGIRPTFPNEPQPAPESERGKPPKGLL